MAKSSRSRSSKRPRQGGGRPATPAGGPKPEGGTSTPEGDASPESSANPEGSITSEDTAKSEDTATSAEGTSKAGGAKAARGGSKSAGGAKPPRAIDRAREANKSRGGGGGGKTPRGAAARRKVEQRRRRLTLIYSALVLAVVGVLVTVIVLDRQQADSTDEDFQATQAELVSAREGAGCTEIEEHEVASATHLPESEVTNPDWSPGDLDWNSNPPASGEHTPPPHWIRPGFYEEQQDERQVVHSLEHGYVAVQYKGISDDQVEQLRELQGGFEGQKLIVQPYEGLDADGVALSAWTFTQTCEQVNLDVINGFIDGLMLPRGTQSVAPEPMAG